MHSQLRPTSLQALPDRRQAEQAKGRDVGAVVDRLEKRSSGDDGASSLADQLKQADLHAKRGRWLEAAAIYGQLADRVPDDHRLWANQGNALWLADLPSPAVLAYRRALSLEPNSVVSLRGLAHCLRDLNQWSEALRLHDRLCALLPDSSPDARHNLWARSQILLGLEQWRDGFEAMALRRRHQGPDLAEILAPQLALVSEQGIGDTFQYVRFIVPLLERRRAAGLRGGVTLSVDRALVQVLQEGLAWLDDAPTVQAMATPAPSQALPTLTLLELAGCLGLDTVEPTSHYLRSAVWPERTAAAGRARRVGLCWAARPARRMRPGRELDHPFTAREYRKRCLPPPALWRLIHALQQQGCELFQLQIGPDAHLGDAFNLTRATVQPAVESLHGTAALVRQLDLVVSVDTSLAHLCGALGVPGWILLPWSADPRWLEQGPSTPWYDSLRLFRQPHPGDWHGAIEQLLACFGDS